jgi:hypothetical protein
MDRRGIESYVRGLGFSCGMMHRHHGEIRPQGREGIEVLSRIGFPLSEKERENREKEYGDESSAVLHHPCD